MEVDTLNYLRFWGVRGSYSAPFGSHMRVGGNTSCVELRADNHVLVFDGGSGIIPLGQALMTQQDIKEVTIMLSHYHWDHISGLPFFIPAFVPGWKIYFYGPGNTAETIEKHISEQMRDPYFPVEIETWMADIHYLALDTHPIEYGPFKIETFNVHHPGSTFGYRIHVHDKLIVYASDNELLFIDKSIEARQHELDPQEWELLQAMQEEERNNAIKSVEGAHVFIQDAQYTEEDYAKKRGWGHSCYVDATHFAMDANINQLYLFHIDPTYNDAKVEELHRAAVKLIHERRSKMECHIAREGLIIDIDKL